MSDVSGAEDAGGEGEGQEVQARQPLAPEEYERRLSAATRDMREQRREIANLREMVQMRATPAEQRQTRMEEPPADDPLATIEYLKTRLKGYDEQFDAQAKAEEEAQKRQGAQQQIARQMQEYERDFRSDHPDYDKAVEHFRKVRAEELAEEGLGGQDLNNALVEGLVSAVARAIRAGKDPAEVVYKLAKNRGFGVDGDTKKLQTITRAQEAGKSLSNAGGRTGDGELTFDYVSSLKGKEFSEAFAKLKAQAKAAERKRA